MDVAELPEAIYEEADTGSSCTDHVCKSPLRYRWDQCLRRTRLTIFRHQQERPRQPLLARVEELIDEIRLGSHAPNHDELQKKGGELMFRLEDAEYFRRRDLEYRTGGNG